MTTIDTKALRARAYTAKSAIPRVSGEAKQDCADAIPALCDALDAVREKIADLHWKRGTEEQERYYQENEVARLRKQIASNEPFFKEIDDLRAEVERLRGLVRHYANYVLTCPWCMDAEDGHADDCPVREIVT